MIEAGARGQAQAKVDEAMTAQAVGSGELRVLATPKLAALVEEAAWRSVSPQLDEGQTTVGTHLDLDHLAPTAVGMTLTCTTELVSVDRRRLVFSFEAADGAGTVAKGSHERFVVDAQKFQAKADARA